MILNSIYNGLSGGLLIQQSMKAGFLEMASRQALQTGLYGISSRFRSHSSLIFVVLVSLRPLQVGHGVGDWAFAFNFNWVREVREFLPRYLRIYIYNIP